MAEFTSFQSFRALLASQPGPDSAAEVAAATRNAQLTKPPGALGRLEDLAIWYASWRGTDRPRIAAPQVIIFAGNHGVTARGVSAFPPEVTAQMVANFQAGGAAINQLADLAGARMDVHALELDRPTQDFTQGPAMTEAECVAALQTGWDAVDPASDLLIAGEMGIGNTTSASAIALTLFGGEAADWIGRGTGVDDTGLSAKRDAVTAGAARQTDKDPLQVLAGLGGRELAAMAGAIAAARHHRIPVILDGFICCAASSCLAEAQPGALDHCIASHESAEQAHQKLLAKIGKVPFLSLGMRLGEGSGGAVAIHLLKAAIACHSGMATFAEAGVAEE